jgi:hypothetical protein
MSHFFKTDSPCVEKTATTLGINVRLPNGYIIMSTHTALLDLPTLPLAARQAHLFPDLSNSALLSISQVCDHGFEARFNSKTVRIMHDDTVIFAGLVRLLHWPLANLPTTKHLAAHYTTCPTTRLPTNRQQRSRTHSQTGHRDLPASSLLQPGSIQLAQGN